MALQRAELPAELLGMGPVEPLAQPWLPGAAHTLRTQHTWSGNAAHFPGPCWGWEVSDHSGCPRHCGSSRNHTKRSPSCLQLPRAQPSQAGTNPRDVMLSAGSQTQPEAGRGRQCLYPTMNRMVVLLPPWQASPSLFTGSGEGKQMELLAISIPGASLAEQLGFLLFLKCFSVSWRLK